VARVYLDSAPRLNGPATKPLAATLREFPLPNYQAIGPGTVQHGTFCHSLEPGNAAITATVMYFRRALRLRRDGAAILGDDGHRVDGGELRADVVACGRRRGFCLSRWCGQCQIQLAEE
jgi:hypothetical protein